MKYRPPLPAAEKFGTLLQILSERRATVREMAEALGVAEVNFSMIRARVVRLEMCGAVREAGEHPPTGKRRGAKIYAITEAGVAMLERIKGEGQ